MQNIKPNIAEIQPYVPGVLKPGAIKLASNENPLGTSPKALKALQKALKQSYLYPDGACQELKVKLAAKLKLEPENLIIGNGSDEIFIFVAGGFISASEEIITSEVTFSEYAFSAKLFNGKAVTVPMKDGRYQLQDFPKYITEKTKLIFIANPNNPTGTYCTHSELEQLLQTIPKNILVILDEAYYEYVQAKDYPDGLSLLKKYDNLFITRTFSKIYGLAGLRIGYGIGSIELIAYLNKTREPFNVNSLAQKAAIAALPDKEFLKKSILNNNAGKRYLYKALTKLKLKYFASEGNFVFVNLPIDGTEVFKKLMALGVTVRPMKGFGVPKAIRVTVGTLKQNKYFIESLIKIL